MTTVVQRRVEGLAAAPVRFCVRRNALQPDDVGVATYGRRRVPGLRREEVALLAGVSSSYYTRIEQGTAGTVSGSILRSLADALQLDEDDRAQVYRLAGAGPERGERHHPAVLLPSLAAVLDHLDGVPAGALGHDMRLLCRSTEPARSWAASGPGK